MRTIEIKVYEFCELSEEAKDVARSDYRERFSEYPFAADAFKSLKALAAHFGGKVSDYSVDFGGYSHSWVSFKMPEMEEHEIKDALFRLGSFNPATFLGCGDCVLTGYCADEDAIDGLRKAWFQGERDLEKLMQAAFSSWLKACQGDYVALFEDEDIDERIESNGLEFTGDGKRFRGEGVKV